MIVLDDKIDDVATDVVLRIHYMFIDLFCAPKHNFTARAQLNHIMKRLIGGTMCDGQDI